MKHILAILACSILSACITTKTTNPDGSTTTTTSQDPKTIKALENIGEVTGAAFGKEAADAAVNAIQQQINK